MCSLLVNVTPVPMCTACFDHKSFPLLLLMRWEGMVIGMRNVFHVHRSSNTWFPAGGAIRKILPIFWEVQPCWGKHVSEGGLQELLAMLHLQFPLCLMSAAEDVTIQVSALTSHCHIFPAVNDSPSETINQICSFFCVLSRSRGLSQQKRELVQLAINKLLPFALISSNVFN